MQLGGTSQEAVRGSLRGLGYDDALIRADWTPHDVVGSANPITLPLTAFWSKPYDQFRSAIAVVADGGVAPRQAAQRSMSHVLQCKDQTATLWLLGETDLVRKDHAPIGQLEGLLNAHRDEVERDTVARTKMRLRQYALYEADPHGHAFWQWVIRPTIDQARSRLENLVAQAKSRWDLDVPTEDWARWLFRVVALRVGLDGNWSVTKGLGREDVRGFVQRAEQYPTKWSSAARLSHEQRRDIVELALDILQHFNFETVDHLFVSKAVGAASLQPLRKAIDLFPTPKPFAWDMMASIPLTKEVGVCDATAGTGTFLIAGRPCDLGQLPKPTRSPKCVVRCRHIAILCRPLADRPRSRIRLRRRRLVHQYSNCKARSDRSPRRQGVGLGRQPTLGRKRYCSQRFV